MGSWIDSLDDVNDNIQEVWDTFVQEFNDHFSDSQLQQWARLELDKCKMRFPDMDQYISDFEDLVRQVGYTIGNEETIGFFLNGLTLSILDEVIRAPFPMTYNEYKAKAVEIMKGRQMIELIRARRGLPNPRSFNNTFGQNRGQFQPQAWGGCPQQNQTQRQQQQQQQQRPTYNSTNAPRPAYNNVQVPMDLSRTRAPYNRCQYQGNNTYTNTTTTQPTQFQEESCHPRPKGPCFNCGKPGHFTRDCCSAPASNVNYMDSTEEDMQNVPQLTIAPRTNIANLKAQIDSLCPNIMMH
jgi:Retrotransposon gag protein/Zinc knuckle